MEVRPWEAETIERAKKAELELVRRLEEVERRTPNADPYVAHYSLLDKEGQKVRRMANAGQKLARGIEEEAYRRLNEGGGVGYAISMRLSAISNDPAIQNALPKHSDVIDEGQVKKLLEQLKDKAQIEPLGVSLKQESKPVDTSREGGASMEVKKPKI